MGRCKCPCPDAPADDTFCRECGGECDVVGPSPLEVATKALEEMVGADRIAWVPGQHAFTQAMARLKDMSDRASRALVTIRGTEKPEETTKEAP